MGDPGKQTQCELQEDYSIIFRLVGVEFLIQDGLLENFLHYTRERSHVPGCVSHSLCRSAQFNAPLPLPSARSPLLPVQNMPPADIFSLEKWPILWVFFKAFLSYVSSFIAVCHLSHKSTYAFFLPPSFLLKCRKSLNFKRNKLLQFFFFFGLFSCRNGSTNAISR